MGAVTRELTTPSLREGETRFGPRPAAHADMLRPDKSATDPPSPGERVTASVRATGLHQAQHGSRARAS